MLELTILTPERELFSGAAKSVKVPGTSGQFEVLNGHAPIVSSLQKGTIRVISPDGKKEFPIERGFIEVLRNEVSLLVTEHSVTEDKE
jgi:F-type H+-transporting ATPase subunit epsilon